MIPHLGVQFGGSREGVGDFGRMRRNEVNPLISGHNFLVFRKGALVRSLTGELVS
jgi:hypothetical protein